jgi:hypothetical protein
MVFIVVKPFFFINENMHFCKFHRLYIFAKYTLTLKYLHAFRKSKNRSSIKSLACYTKNELPNFNEYTITMKGNE